MSTTPTLETTFNSKHGAVWLRPGPLTDCFAVAIYLWDGNGAFATILRPRLGELLALLGCKEDVVTNYLKLLSPKYIQETWDIPHPGMMAVSKPLTCADAPFEEHIAILEQGYFSYTPAR